MVRKKKNNNTMKTKFFGFFEDKLKSVEINGLTKTESPNLFRVMPEYKFESEGIHCYAWGQFYDLEKTCNDLYISHSENPAEIIAAIFRNEKYQVIEALYGEFTYLFIDTEKIFIGRDIVGAGLPVFYNDKFFTDNIDNFKLIKGFDFTPDADSIKTFLHIGTPMPPKTLVKNISQLLPGEYLLYKNHTLTTQNIYSFEKYTQNFGTLKLSEHEAVEELERLHKAAIVRRIKNRPNIALLMSGGYDSGGNIAALRDVHNGKAKGYSIGFKDDQWSELPIAKFLANEFNIDFKSYLIDGSEIEELPLILRDLGHPFQENGLMVNYTVMKMVQNDNNDIILGGDGNDQVYGTGIQNVALHHLAAKYGIKPFQAVLSGMLAGTNHKLLSKVQFHNSKILHIENHTTFGFNESEINKLLRNKGEKLNTNFIKSNNLHPKSFDDLFKSYTYYKDFMFDGCNLITFKASSMARLFGQKLSFPYMDMGLLHARGIIGRNYNSTV